MELFQMEQFVKGGGILEERCERISSLRETEIFHSMSEETMETLLALPVREFAAGAVIADGDEKVSLGVLLSGKAAIYGRDSGRRVLLNRIEKSSVFDAATVFFSEKGTVSAVVAKTKCRVLFIERSVLETIIGSDANVAHDYIIFLSDKICFLNRKIIAFTAKNADAALAGFLLESACEKETVSLNMTRAASTLDIGRTTLYRAMDALERDGCIAYDGGEIRILDREKLRSRAKD